MIQKANKTVETLYLNALSATVQNVPVGTYDVVNKQYLDSRVSSTDVSAINIGDGYGWFVTKSGSNLEFKTLSAGDGTTIRDNGSAIAIDAFISANGSDLRLNTAVYTSPGSATYNIPPNTRALIIEVVGAGGGGYPGESNPSINGTAHGGAGGGGGSYAYVEFDPSVLSTSTLTITVGAGGGSALSGGNTYVQAGTAYLAIGYGGSAATGISSPGSGAAQGGGTGTSGITTGTGIQPTPAIGAGGGGGGAGATGIGGGSQAAGTAAIGGNGGAGGGISLGTSTTGTGSPYVITGGAGGAGGAGGPSIGSTAGTGYSGIYGGGGGGGGGGWNGGAGGAGGDGLVRIRAYTTHSGDIANTYSTGGATDLFFGLSAGDSILRTISSAGGTTLVSSASVVTISSAPIKDVITTGNGIDITAGWDASHNYIRSLSAGSNVTITSAASVVVINVPTVGEINTLNSLGGQIDLVAPKVGTALNIRTLNAGGSVTIVSGTNVITISSNAEANTLSGIGGQVDLVADKNSAVLNVRTLSAGPGIALLSSSNVISISAGGSTGGGSTNTNIGGQIEIAVGGTNNIRTLSAGNGIAILSSANVLTLSAASSGGGGGGSTNTNIGGQIELAVGGTNNIRTLSAGPGITLLSSASVLALSATPGGDFFTYYDVNKPPTSPSSLDDEFTGTSLNTKWTVFGAPSYSVANDLFSFAPSPTTGDVIKGIIQPVSGDYTIISRILKPANATGGNPSFGLVLTGDLVNSPSTAPVFGFWFYFGTAPNLNTSNFTNVTTYNSAGTSTTALGSTIQWVYLKIIKVSTSYTIQYSTDGYNWTTLTTTGPLFTPSYAGIGLDMATSPTGLPAQLYVDFWRYYSSNPSTPLGGQRTVGSGAPVTVSGTYDSIFDSQLGVYKSFLTSLSSTQGVVVSAVTLANVGGQTELAVGGTSTVRTLSASTGVALVSSSTSIAISSTSLPVVSTWAATRPSNPPLGLMYQPTDSFFYEIYGSSGWQTYYGGRPVSPPSKLSGWSWLNQGTATIDTSKGAFILSAPCQSGDQFRIYLKSVINTNFTITSCFRFMCRPSNYGTAELVLRESSTGKLVKAGFAYNGGYRVGFNQWSSVTSGVADYGNWNYGVPFTDMWFRLQQTASNLIFSISQDGYVWDVLSTQTRTSYFTSGADQYGIGINCNNATTSQTNVMTVISFAESTP